MMKKNLIYAMISAAVMLLLPFLAVTLVRNDGGMAICLVLFFAVNPIWSVFIGLFAGKNIKASWFQPLLSAVLFLVGVWLLFDMGEPDFLIYATIYFAIGVSTMMVKFLVHKKT